jgi:hypothetical protein
MQTEYIEPARLIWEILKTSFPGRKLKVTTTVSGASDQL